MIFKTLFNSSLIFSLFLVLSLSSNGQADKAKATQNTMLKATVTEVEQLDRSQWVWRNMFNDNRGIVSTRLLANDDTLGGKSCIAADDFPVGADTTWYVDTLRTYLFWYKKAPDRVQVIIWPDFWGAPAEDSVCHDFTFTAEMPVELTLYDMKVGVESQNISLSTGIYWISFMGVYDEGTMAADTFLTLANRKDTLIGPAQMMLMDSIGAHYLQYPTPWLGIYFDGENEFNSMKFWIKADVEVGISNNTFQKPKSLVSVYPNPASEHILFQFKNTSGKYIEIYDVKGKLVKTVTALTRNKKVNIKSLTNGIYFYQLMDKSKSMIDRGKFSISK